MQKKEIQRNEIRYRLTCSGVDVVIIYCECEEFPLFR